MAYLWLITKSGSLIHVPIAGEVDFNTPDTPTKIPTSIIARELDRCVSGNYTFEIDGQSVTVLLDPPGRTGSCNQCGECCSHLVTQCPNPTGDCGYIVADDPLYHKCQYLNELKGPTRGIGKVGGTECSVHRDLLDLYKGCVFYPEQASDVENCPDCGFSWTV